LVAKSSNTFGGLADILSADSLDVKNAIQQWKQFLRPIIYLQNNLANKDLSDTAF